MEHYGEKIAKIMDEDGLTQTEVAKRTGFAQTSVSNWLKNHLPPLEFIVKFLLVYRPNIKLWQFFIDEKEEAEKYDLNSKLLPIFKRLSKEFPHNIDDYQNVIIWLIGILSDFLKQDIEKDKRK